MSIYEFGREHLFMEQFWLPVAVLRTGVDASVVGGVSRCMRELFRAVLFQPCNLLEVGIAVQLDAPTLIRITIKHIIGDEAALKYCWDCKGAGGIQN